MKSSTTAFITHLPIPNLSSSQKGLHSKRACCGVRSSTAPPPPPSNGENQPDQEKNDDMQSTRTALEKVLSIDLKTTDGRDGKCDCIWCGGTKQRMCRWCNGNGYREEFVHKSWEQLSIDIEKMQNGAEPMKAPEKVPVQCSACSGTKKLRCAYCLGSGIGSYGHAY